MLFSALVRVGVAAWRGVTLGGLLAPWMSLWAGRGNRGDHSKSRLPRELRNRYTHYPTEDWGAIHTEYTL